MSLTGLAQRRGWRRWLASWTFWGLPALVGALGAFPAHARASHHHRSTSIPSWLQEDPAAVGWYRALRAPHERAAWWTQSLMTQQSQAFNFVLGESTLMNNDAWLLHLSLPTGIHLHLVNGVLPDTPLVEYLTWRRSLDPTRFDHWHPNVGPLIAESALNQQDPDQGQTVTPPPNNPGGNQVSEPSAALVGIALGAAAGWLRRKALARS
jgi:hypothetical protein